MTRRRLSHYRHPNRFRRRYRYQNLSLNLSHRRYQSPIHRPNHYRRQSQTPNRRRFLNHYLIQNQSRCLSRYQHR